MKLHEDVRRIVEAFRRALNVCVCVCARVCASLGLCLCVWGSGGGGGGLGFRAPDVDKAWTISLGSWV